MKTIATSILFSLALLCVPTAQADSIESFGSGANAFTMTFVPIGNPGNAADTTGSPNPAGSVAHNYRMGKYEVSRDMVTKANVVGNLGITLNDMTSFGGNGLNRPATGVSWNEAARYVNWLNTSQGYQAAYNFTTSGVNDNIALWSSADAWQLGGENLFRHKDTHYWLPSVDEWYKAAYYKPTTMTYGDYPTSNGLIPTAVAGGTTADTAVYGQPTNQGPANIDNAGGLSPFGVMGLGGNVFEWNETESDLVNNSTSSVRWFSGGGWNASSLNLSSSTPNILEPAFEGGVGFRVASIPEPSSAALLMLATVGLWQRRKRPS